MQQPSFTSQIVKANQKKKKKTVLPLEGMAFKFPGFHFAFTLWLFLNEPYSLQGQKKKKESEFLVLCTPSSISKGILRATGLIHYQKSERRQGYLEGGIAQYFYASLYKNKKNKKLYVILLDCIIFIFVHMYHFIKILLSYHQNWRSYKWKWQ